MPRKNVTPEAAGAGAVHKAAAGAAKLLYGELAECGGAIQLCLRSAADGTLGFGMRETYFEIAIRLMDASARLGESIAKVKGEMHQHIRVERAGGAREGATRSPVPNVPKRGALSPPE